MSNNNKTKCRKKRLQDNEYDDDEEKQATATPQRNNVRLNRKSKQEIHKGEIQI